MGKDELLMSYCARALGNNLWGIH